MNLHLSATERRSEVLSWIRNLWCPAWGELEHLSPEGWFTEGHQALGACEELPFWKLWIGNCAFCGEMMKEGEGNFVRTFALGEEVFLHTRKYGARHAIPSQMVAPIPLGGPPTKMAWRFWQMVTRIVSETEGKDRRTIPFTTYGEGDKERD